MNLDEVRIILAKNMRDVLRQVPGLLSVCFQFALMALLCAFALQTKSDVLLRYNQPKVRVSVPRNEKLLCDAFSRDREVVIIDSDKTPNQLLASGEADLIVLAPPNFSASVQSKTNEKPPEVVLRVNDGRLNSDQNSRRAWQTLKILQDQLLSTRLAALGIEPPLREKVTYLKQGTDRPKSDNEESEADSDSETMKEAGKPPEKFLMIAVPLFVLLMVSMTGAAFGYDVLLEEREKGTLVLLLMSPIAKKNIVIANFLLIFFWTTVYSIFAYLFFVGLVGWRLSPFAEAEMLASLQPPSPALWLAIPLMLPLILMVSSASTLVSCYCLNRRHITVYTVWSVLITQVCSTVLFFQRSTWNWAIGLLPISNTQLCLYDAYSGVYHADLIAVTVLTSVVISGLLLRASCRRLEEESFLSD